MAKKEVGPGVVCRIIGSSVGPKGSSIGKIVRVLGLTDPPIHALWGDMWDVEAIDGSMFEVKITSPDLTTTHIQQSRGCVCATDWLDPLDEDPTAPKADATERERDLVN
jgi:hypothetical protein